MEKTRVSAIVDDRRFRTLLAGSLCFCFLLLASLQSARSTLRAQEAHALKVRQVYAGGAAFAPWNADYLELFNAGTGAIDLQGWTLQAAPAAADSWLLLQLDARTLEPGATLLIGLSPDAGGVPLPAPDMVWEIDLNLAGGSVRIVDPGGVFVDAVAWGEGAFGEGAPAPALNYAEAALRRDGGCRDTEDNQTDFALVAPEPHNGASPPAPCALQSPTETPSPTEPASPTETPPPAATPTPSTTPSATPTPTATSTPPGMDGLLFLSEVFPEPLNPQVGVGDWLELVNAGSGALNLRGWSLRTGGGAVMTLTTDFWVEAGGYVVLAQRALPEDQSGVPVAHADAALLLGAVDSVQVMAPTGRVADAFAWGDAVRVVAGHSLERTALAPDAPWQAAWQPWSGEGAGWGSPGRAFQPPPTPTPAPMVRISEYLAEPDAVPDADGEWVELQNPNEFAVEMAGWSLGDSAGEVVALDRLTIAAQGYAIVGRNADATVNGGVQIQASLGGVRLANDGDDLHLRAPDGTTIDWAAWGDGNPITPGRSMERLAEGSSRDQVWRKAVQPWPGSAGDWGSPGSPPPVAPPAPTATATLPAPPALPAAWESVATPPPLQIDEVAWRGAGGEYVVLVNRSAGEVALTGWSLSDAEVPGNGEGLHYLPAHAVVPAGGGFVVARDGEKFRRRWFVSPDAQFKASGDGAVVLVAHAAMAAPFNLDDGGDEVLLLTPDLRVADAVAWGDHAGAVLGVEGTLTAAGDQALQRAGDLPWPSVRDVRHRFVVAAQEPLLPVTLPAPAPRTPIVLSGGLRALWGTLGAPTTFSAGGATTPLMALSVAAARGLDFAALADSQPLPSLPFAPPAALLPAWSWHGGDDSAVVFGPFMPGLADRWALLPWLQGADAAALWLGRGEPPVPWFGAAWAGAWPPRDPAEAARSMLGLWRSTGAPLLPALDGRLDLGAWASASPVAGLAAESNDAAALLEALRARRGWLTTTPGVWLTLAAESPAGAVWMGGSVAPANQIILTLMAGDRDARPLTVTLWQDDEIIDVWQASGGATHQARLLARPGAFIFATATGAGGIFAITAPLHVEPNPGPRVHISEVMADPEDDLDGDGVGGEADEFVELWNPGDLPVALAGWQLADLGRVRSGGFRFTFGSRAVIPAHGVLVIWRAQSDLALNNDADRLYLFSPGGGIADEVGWSEWPQPGLALARGEGGWQHGRSPTPGWLGDDGAAAVAIGAATLELAGAASVLPVDSAAAPAGNAPLPALAEPAEGALAAEPIGEAAATPGPSIAYSRRIGLGETTWLEGVVVVPPGLFNGSLYLADVAADGVTAGAGIRIYLPLGDFPALHEGDRIGIVGEIRSFRGEKEIGITGPAAVFRLGGSVPLLPLPVRASALGEPLESRLVRFEAVVAATDGDSIFVVDPEVAQAPPVRVVVLRSLGWPRPAAQAGEVWRVTGVVGQMARASPWNGGYRVLVRYPDDLVRLR